MSHPKSRSSHGKSLARILRTLGPSAQQTTSVPPGLVIPASPTGNSDAATELSGPPEHAEEKGKGCEVQEASINKAYESSLSDDGSIDLMFNNISREREDWDSFLKELKEARKNSMHIRHITDERFKSYKAEVNKFKNDMKLLNYYNFGIMSRRSTEVILKYILGPLFKIVFPETKCRSLRSQPMLEIIDDINVIYEEVYGKWPENVFIRWEGATYLANAPAGLDASITANYYRKVRDKRRERGAPQLPIASIRIRFRTFAYKYYNEYIALKMPDRTVYHPTPVAFAALVPYLLEDYEERVHDFARKYNILPEDLKLALGSEEDVTYILGTFNCTKLGHPSAGKTAFSELVDVVLAKISAQFHIQVETLAQDRKLFEGLIRHSLAWPILNSVECLHSIFVDRARITCVKPATLQSYVHTAPTAFDIAMLNDVLKFGDADEDIDEEAKKQIRTINFIRQEDATLFRLCASLSDTEFLDEQMSKRIPSLPDSS